MRKFILCQRIFGINIVRRFNMKIFDRKNLMINGKKSLITNNSIFLNLLRSASDFPPHKIAKLPNLSPTMETGAIQVWEKKEGDRLEEGDVLCQVETDKAVMGMETPHAGFLAKILFPAGTKNIAVGQPIAVIVKKSDQIAAFKNFISDESLKLKSSDKVNKNMDTTGVNARADKSNIISELMQTSLKTKATPYARLLAEKENIDVKNLVGSGPEGLVVARDIPETLAQKKMTDATSRSKIHPCPFTDTELTSMRSTIAQRLLLSSTTIPHFYLNIDIEMDKLISLRTDLNRQIGEKIKISINDFIIKAAGLTLHKIPQCNSQWHDKFIREFHRADISVAVSTESGLITPILFDVNSKSIGYISQEMKDLAQKAKINKLTMAEFQGGTFTISNLGMLGISDFTAIINPPQSCILSVGCISQRYVKGESDFQPNFKSYMRVTLGCDHRVVDGAIGATWLKTFKETMESPYTILV